MIDPFTQLALSGVFAECVLLLGHYMSPLHSKRRAVLLRAAHAAIWVTILLLIFMWGWL